MKHLSHVCHGHLARVLESQLTAATDPEATYNFTYDSLGRRTSITHDLPTLGFDIIIDQAYDALGRRTSLTAEVDTTDDLINTYSYDYLNRMTQVIQTSQTGGNAVADKRVDFTYDAEDKHLFTTIQRYTSTDTSELVATSTYTYDLAEQLTALAHKDASTNTTTVENHLTYNAFGKITYETNAAIDLIFGFTGRERDEESSLQYNRARYYSSDIGKWMSQDPIRSTTQFCPESYS